MARGINPNTMSNTDVLNARAQAQMTQLVQKLGKGKRRVKVSLSKPSRSYLEKMIAEMKKQMVVYEKQLPNIFQFFKYFENEVKITKENKKIKNKEILLSYEELDFIKLNIKETIKGVDKMILTLKWYNFFKKTLYKTIKKQNELVLEELGKTTVNK